MNKSILSLLLLICYSFVAVSCELKSKTELYLERGLDILNNKEQLDFSIYDSVTIEELGVIRDRKENLKTLVFKLNPDAVEENFLDEKMLGVRVWIIDSNNNKRIENWDFKPHLTIVNGFKYITKKIEVQEDQIKKMKIYMFRIKNGNKLKTGDSLMLNKVNTYND